MVILSIVYEIPIVILNSNNKILYICNKGLVYDNKSKNNDIINKYKSNTWDKCYLIRFNQIIDTNNVSTIDALYKFQE